MPSVWHMVVALIVTAAGALVQGIVGMGFAVVAVPVLSLVDSRLAPVPQLLLALPLTLSMAWRERTAMDLGGVRWIIAGRFVGAIAGVALIKMATDRTLDVLIAIAVLSAVIIVAAGVAVRRTRATQLVAGTFSGTASIVASIGGPPVALLYRGAPPDTVRSSLAAVFAIGLLVSIATRTVAREITSQDIVIALILLPALAVGYVASLRLRFRFDAVAVKNAILVISTFAAVGLLIRAVG